MALSQGDQFIRRCESNYKFLFKSDILQSILRIHFFFSDNVMVEEGCKQQTTDLFLSTIVTSTRRHTEEQTNPKNVMGKLCCARED